MNRWQKFRLLTWAERGLFLQALVLLPTTALALRVLGFNRLRSIMASRALAGTSRKDAKDSHVEKAVGIVKIVRAASRHGIHRGNCLNQSLVSWWLLSRRGIGSDLCFGAKKEAGELKAHAWLEVAGVAVNDGTDVHERFAPFDRAVVPADVKFQ